MFLTLFLVVLTIFKGFSIESNPFFLFIESILNLVIIADFICRVRLAGMRRFFREGEGRVWNIIDCCVVIGSLLMFLAIIFQ
jgi:hypothetical protein